MEYHKKYLKYKNKYLELKSQIGGAIKRKPILTILLEQTPETKTKRKNLESIIKNKLNHFNEKSIKELYEKVSLNPIKSIKYYTLGKLSERNMIFVKSIFRDGKEIEINRGFYESSGTSRIFDNTTNLWFGTTGIRHNRTVSQARILKLEDTITNNFNDLLENFDTSLYDSYLPIINSVETYGRYLNEENAAIGLYLYLNKEKMYFEYSNINIETFDVEYFLNKFNLTYKISHLKDDYLLNAEMSLLFKYLTFDDKKLITTM